uniref:Uncharacterized protein n=1 Tax=Romanomermis culicivorax TaxID=13658 RepID=A0A915JMT6_ROMCU
MEQNGNDTLSAWKNQQRDFVPRPRPPSKDYYQSKLKQSERRSKSSVNGRFGDADEDELNGSGVAGAGTAAAMGTNVSSYLRRMALMGAEERGRHFEGDIVLTLDQAEEMYERVVHADDKRKRRKFIATQSRRWNPDRPIEYSFDGSH